MKLACTLFSLLILLCMVFPIAAAERWSIGLTASDATIEAIVAMPLSRP
jgi:hypothetical protein